MKNFQNFLNRHRAWLIFAALAFLLILRKPDSFLHAQFVAEDGKYWYADCYQMGASCLWKVQDGYLQTVSRLGGLAAQAVPLADGPTVFVIIAWLIQLLPAAILLSRRAEFAIPNFWVRALLAALYIVLPNIGGSVLFLTCSQWFLALTAALIVIFPAGTRIGRWGDRFLILLSGLSGPFAVMLFPVSFLKWVKTRDRDDLINMLILLVTAAVQAYFVLSFKSVTPRFEGAIPWSARAIYSVIQIQLVWNLLLAPQGYWWLHANWPTWHFWAALLAPPVLAMAVYTFWKMPYEGKLYFLFAGATLLVGLLFPMGIDRSNLFYNLANNTEQLRYWIIPLTAVIVTLVYCSGPRRPIWIKWPARSYLAVLAVGICLNFRYPATPDYHFDFYVKQFEGAAPGQTVEIPMHPVPSYWIMKLTK